MSTVECIHSQKTEIAADSFVYLPVALKAGIMSQYPPLVRSSIGSTVSLYCQLTGIESSCYTIAWMKLHPRSGTLAVYTIKAVEDLGEKSCRADITYATTEDSGTYFCAVVDQDRLSIGNGTTVAVESDNTSSVEIALSVRRRNNSVAVLTCLVLGIHPSKARVFWVLDEGREESGHSELIWTNGSAPATVFTRNQVVVSLPEFALEQTYTCVVHYTHDRTLNRSLTLNDPQRICYTTASLPRMLAIVSTLLLQLLMVAMAQCFKKFKKRNRSVLFR
ncbi:hypothetical protein ACEWY4_024455 [Coilia grayii]|uniref:Ig-like domain-containing protein n=1 Tax=Coilia grayii TaxID=363190 RepID=A0ABD1J0G5_9TELE